MPKEKEVVKKGSFYIQDLIIRNRFMFLGFDYGINRPDAPPMPEGGILFTCGLDKNATAFQTREEAQEAIKRTVEYLKSVWDNWEWGEELYRVLTSEEREYIELSPAQKRKASKNPALREPPIDGTL